MITTQVKGFEKQKESIDLIQKSLDFDTANILDAILRQKVDFFWLFLS